MAKTYDALSLIKNISFIPFGSNENAGKSVKNVQAK